MNELFADWPGGVSDYREWLCVSDKRNVQRDGKVDTKTHTDTHTVVLWGFMSSL